MFYSIIMHTYRLSLLHDFKKYALIAQKIGYNKMLRTDFANLNIHKMIKRCLYNRILTAYITLLYPLTAMVISITFKRRLSYTILSYSI